MPAKIDSYRDLAVWQEAKDLAVAICESTGTFVSPETG